MQAQLADLPDRLNLNMAEAELEAEPEPVARRHRALIESAAAVVPSSRESLGWAAQEETPILTVDDVEAGPDSVEINPQVHVALAELLEGEALDIVPNATRGAGLEDWRKLVRRFDPQTVRWKRTLLSRIINPGTVKSA